MSPKGFSILATATAVSVALAAWAVVGRDAPGSATPGAEQPVVAGLVDRLNEVTSVVVESGDGKLTLRRGDPGGWAVVERGGYPADPDKVRELALGVAGLRLVEAKTAAPDRLSRLEVEEPGPGAKSKRVQLLDAQGAPLAALVVGKTRFGLYGGGRSGVYVRRSGEPQAWLAAGQLDVPTTAMDLVGREFLSVQPNELARVTLGAGGPSPVVMEKAVASDEAFTLRTPPPSGRQADPEKLERLGSSLIALTMQEVKPATEAPPAADAPVARFETWDGLIVDVRTSVVGEGEAARHWAWFTPSSGAPIGAAPTPPEGSPAPPAVERAAAFKPKLEPWSFELPGYLAERMTWTLEDLTAPPADAS